MVLRHYFIFNCLRDIIFFSKGDLDFDVRHSSIMLIYFPLKDDLSTFFQSQCLFLIVPLVHLLWCATIGKSLKHQLVHTFCSCT